MKSNCLHAALMRQIEAGGVILLVPSVYGKITAKPSAWRVFLIWMFGSLFQIFLRQHSGRHVHAMLAPNISAPWEEFAPIGTKKLDASCSEMILFMGEFRASHRVYIRKYGLKK